MLGEIVRVVLGDILEIIQEKVKIKNPRKKSWEKSKKILGKIFGKSVRKFEGKFV